MYFEDVISALQRVCLAVEVEREVRQGGDLGTVDRVLAIPRLLGTDLRVKHFRNVGRKSDERSA